MKFNQTHSSKNPALSMALSTAMSLVINSTTTTITTP